MKRFNADANAKKLVVTRVGVLSFVALMILNLSSGLALAAMEDLKRWKTVDGVQSPAFTFFKKDDKKDDELIKFSVDNLVGKNDEEGFKAWSTKEDLVKNPFKLVQSVVKSAQEAIKQDNFTGFRTAFLKALESKETKLAGMSEKANEKLKELLSKALGKDLKEEELAKLVEKLKTLDEKGEEAFMKEFFSEENSKAMELDVTKKEEVKVAEKPAGVTKEEMEKQIAEAVGKLEKSVEEQIKKLSKSADTATPATPASPAAATPATPTTPAATAATSPGILPGQTGEVFDQVLTPAEQQRCDKEAKLRQDRLDRLNQDREDIIALAAKAESLSRRPGVENLNNDNQDNANLGDLIGKLFASPTPAPVIPPPFQQQQPVASNRDKKKKPFNAPIPQGQPEEPLPPMQFGQNNVNQAPIEVGVNIPVQLGQAESRESRDVLREAEGWNSLAKGVSMNSSRQKILFAKNKAEARKNRVAIAATNARDAANELEEQLTAMQKGAESRLTSSTKQAKDQLTQDIAKLQRQVDAEKAKGATVGQDITARQQLQSTVSGLEAQLNAKNDLLTQVNNKIKTEVENGDQNIQMLAKRFKKLNSDAGKLEQKRDELNGEVELIADLFEQRSQYEQQLAMGPQTTGGRNVFQGAQGVQTPRSVNPRVNNRGTQVGNTQAGGTELRKPLSNIK